MVQFKNNSREFKLRHKLSSDPICPHMESSIISDCTQLLLNFIHCRYKALLARRREPTETREYHRLTMRQRDSYHKKALSGLIASFDSANILVAPTSLSRSIRKHHRLVLKATCSLRGHLIGLPPIEADDPDNGSSRSLTPILFSNANMVREANKLVACVYALLILDQVPNSVRRAKIVYGDGFDVRYVVLRGKNGATRLATEARHVLDEFFKFLGDDSPPPTLRLNRHCDACEFRQRCREEAQQRDDISLLSALSAREVTHWKNKGVLTSIQLAHTFQPRRYCRPNYTPRQHSQALQALAVQQQTVFIRKTPTLRNAAVQIYLDVEGVPDDSQFYLIGMIRENSDDQSVSQLWGSSEDEKAIWQAFTKKIETFPDEFVVFHFGSYECRFIETMLKRHGTCGSERVRRLNERMCDIHDAIRTKVFFPAYSNRLKDIAGSLGFRWSGPIMTGIESITWRKQWEATRHDRFKDDLLRYNQEDCEALKTVVRYLQCLETDRNGSSVNVEDASNVDSHSNHQFGTASFAIPEMRGLTKRAYFNYQRDRIFARINPNVRRSIRRRTRRKVTVRVNKRVICEAPQACPTCEYEKLRLYETSVFSKRVTDLRFSENGVRRWVTEYTTQRWMCPSCRISFYSPEYPIGGRHFGHGIASWVVHQLVAARQSHQLLVDNLNDLFGVSFRVGVAKASMRELSCKTERTEQLLVSRLRQGNVIFADETKVKVRGGTGYVWAFSGIEEVVYRFTETRDAAILKEFLDGFQGVIVSDFYSGYDSAPCEQQKCLVHLIRDINDDLLKEPFNEELKELASRFTELLKAIVDDIDKFGLKRRHLNKFIRPASQFEKWVLSQEFRTKSAQRYHKRIRKYGKRLFTFLCHDGVPWNNNIAENAIKLVVSRRRLFGASYSKEGMRDYLRFLSFFQTLRRKGGSLLRFLLSKETDLFRFLGE